MVYRMVMAELALYINVGMIIVKGLIVVFMFKYLLKIIRILEEIRDKNN